LLGKDLTRIMLTDILYLIAGLTVLILGAEILVRGAAGLAVKMKVPPLIVGLTIVAFGTSSPELVVSAKAAFVGKGSIALGTVVGSNICNILLILGVSALITPIGINRRIVKIDVPIMIFVSLILTAILYTGELTRIYAGILFAGILAYTGFTIFVALREVSEDDEVIPAANSATWLLVIMALIGPIMLALGSDWMLNGAISMATRLGVSEAIIGLTILALGGSLPELVTAVVASIKLKGDLVVGNIVGSNIFNILCVLGVAGLVSPIPFEGINYSDLWIMVAVAFVALQTMHRGWTIKRGEGVFMLLSYGAYIWFVTTA